MAQEWIFAPRAMGENDRRTWPQHGANWPFSHLSAILHSAPGWIQNPCFCHFSPILGQARTGPAPSQQDCSSPAPRLAETAWIYPCHAHEGEIDFPPNVLSLWIYYFLGHMIFCIHAYIVPKCACDRWSTL